MSEKRKVVLFEGEAYMGYMGKHVGIGQFEVSEFELKLVVTSACNHVVNFSADWPFSLIMPKMFFKIEVTEIEGDESDQEES